MATKNTYWTVDEMEYGFNVWHTGMVRYSSREDACAMAHYLRCKINSENGCWSWAIGTVGDVRATKHEE